MEKVLMVYLDVVVDNNDDEDNNKWWWPVVSGRH